MTANEIEHEPRDLEKSATVVEPPSADAVPFREAFRTWLKVAALSFGGPAGQIAVMHRIIVDEKKWIGEERFLHALNYCMLLPGPEAQQLATYIGWLMHGMKGGLTAGLLFVLPGFISILGLSIIYATLHQVDLVQAVFFGLKPAVLAIVFEAVLRIGKRVLKNNVMVWMAGASFVAIFFFAVPFPALILAAALIGFVGGNWAPKYFLVIQKPSNDAGASPLPSARSAAIRSLLVGSAFLTLWFAPLLAVAATLGVSSVYYQEGIFFSKAAVVTFGGAYSVLAYVAQQAVEKYGWLQPGEMLDGLGMAETTPGPLIQVVQFVAFMGAYRDPGPFHPMVAGILGSILTAWVTFAPCFLWIFLGAPYIEKLRGNRLLSAALSAITAAVVGVVLNLAVWFSLHTLFKNVTTEHLLGFRLLIPQWETVDLSSCLVAVLAMLLAFYWKAGMALTLGISALAGAILYYTVGYSV